MRRPTLEDRLEYIGVILFLKGARLLSPVWALRLGSALGHLAFDLFRFRRTVTLSNLRTHMADSDLRCSRVRVGRRSYANFGMTIAEFVRLPLVGRAYIDEHVNVEGLQNLDRAMRAGKGAILVTGHFGSWELMGCVLAHLGYPVTFVVGIQRNPLVQALMNDLRHQAGIEIIELTSTQGIVRALRAGRFIAMLCDQDAGRAGVFVRFLGDQASTAQGAAGLAIITGAPIIPGFIVRLGGSKQRIVIERPVPAPEVKERADAIRSITQAYTNTIESYVRQHPDHWLWAHRRWKTRPV
ncbi:MAG: lysophospholipid acyltransferase family protein [Candidatus Eisenbacteria bacterium]